MGHTIINKRYHFSVFFSTLIGLVALFGVIPSYAITSDMVVKTTIIAGFVQLGQTNESPIGVTIAKSLSTALSRIPSSSIIPYQNLENYTQNSKEGLISTNLLNSALKIAQHFSAKQVIYGTYSVNRKLEKIQITVYLADVVNGEILFQHEYKGDSGLGLFDTIDTMNTSVSGLLLGKNITFGTLKLFVQNSTQVYDILYFGKTIAQISNNGTWSEKLPAQEPLDFSLKIHTTDKIVFHTTLSLSNGSEKVMRYSPSGNLIVYNHQEDAILYLENKPVTELKQGSNTLLQGLPADKRLTFQLKNSISTLSEKSVLIPEADTTALVFNSSPATKSVHYQNALVPLNIVIPGFAQYQSDDGWIGTVFLIGGYGGAYLGLYSLWKYFEFKDLYQQNNTDAQDILYYQMAANYRILSLVGLSVWGGATSISIIHALLQPTYWSKESASGQLVFGLSKHSAGLEFQKFF